MFARSEQKVQKSAGQIPYAEAEESRIEAKLKMILAPNQRRENVAHEIPRPAFAA